MKIDIDDVERKLVTLRESIWEYIPSKSKLEGWLANFSSAEEREYGMYLLSHFMYFGEKQIEELLRALYRDLYKYPIVEDIRRNNRDTTNLTIIRRAFQIEQAATRFVAVGGAAKSSAHLLYPFRKANRLNEVQVVNQSDLFLYKKGKSVPYDLREARINRYVFVDDIFGSGKQAIEKAGPASRHIKRLRPAASVYYFTLFGTSQGLASIRETSLFDGVSCVVEFDDTFRSLSPNSRYFDEDADRVIAREICERYGGAIHPDHPLGWGGCELMVGFHHNTPNNTLPIFWKRRSTPIRWQPLFDRS